MQKKREEWEAEQEKRKKRNPEAEDEEFNEENVRDGSVITKYLTNGFCRLNWTSVSKRLF